MSKSLIFLVCLTFMSMAFSSHGMQKSEKNSFTKKTAAIGFIFLLLTPTIYADTQEQQEKHTQFINKVFFKCTHSKRTSSHCKYLDCVFESKTPEQEAQCEYNTNIDPDASEYNESILPVFTEYRNSGTNSSQFKYKLGTFLMRYQNKTQAITKLIEAAEYGSPEAQYDLGNYFYLGEGVKENLTLAKKWIGMAAAQQFPKAHDYLFEIYLYEHGIDEAVNFFIKAAKGGDASASSTLDKKACDHREHNFMLNRCIKRAEKGDYLAAMRLGDAFLSGTEKGIKQDTDKAIYFLKKAEIGYSHGSIHYQLATAYCQKTKEFCQSKNKKKQKENGCQNNIQAIKWFDEAKKDGFEKAKKETREQFTQRCGNCCCILL